MNLEHEVFNLEQDVNGGIKLVGVKDKRITEAIIPEGVTVIGDFAFRECRELSKVVIPNSVSVIGSSAFRTCFTVNQQIKVQKREIKS